MSTSLALHAGNRRTRTRTRTRRAIRGLLPLLMAALALWPAPPTAAAGFAPVTLNIDAEAHREASPATVTLPAGTYVLTVVQGQFRAWNGWNGSTLDCNAEGSGCTRGWLTEYRYASPSLGNRTAEFNGRFRTESLAFAAASNGTTIALPAAETVRFWVNDSVYRDNLGGVSLRIEAVSLLDTSAPSIATAMGGTLGTNGWFVSDVSVTWTVTDAESTVTDTTGCEARRVASDTAGTTFTCRATSGGAPPRRASPSSGTRRRRQSRRLPRRRRTPMGGTGATCRLGSSARMRSRASPRAPGRRW